MTDLERMRAEAEERKYQRMVANASPPAAMKNSLKAHEGFSWATNFGTQVIAAFIGAFLLGYYFVETFVDQHNTVTKVIVGAMCSFFTLLLETCLLVIHDSKDQ